MEDKLEFSNMDEIQHHMATSVADDLIRDYEKSIKNAMKFRDVYSYTSSLCSVLLITVSLICGIIGTLAINESLSKAAAVVTLTIGAIDRLKFYSDKKYEQISKQLIKMFGKSGLNTYGIYERPASSTASTSPKSD